MFTISSRSRNNLKLLNFDIYYRTFFFKISTLKSTADEISSVSHGGWKLHVPFRFSNAAENNAYNPLQLLRQKLIHTARGIRRANQDSCLERRHASSSSSYTAQCHWSLDQLVTMHFPSVPSLCGAARHFVVPHRLGTSWCRTESAAPRKVWMKFKSTITWEHARTADDNETFLAVWNFNQVLQASYQTVVRCSPLNLGIKK